MCRQEVSLPLEQRHCVSVSCVVLCPHQELLGPHRGGDHLPEEVIEDGGWGGGGGGGGVGEPAVHGRGGAC